MKSNKITKGLNLAFRDRLNIVRACKLTNEAKASKRDLLCDQILDSIIVGSITGISAYIYAGETISLKAGVLSFLLTFLIKMKEYRKIT